MANCREAARAALTTYTSQEGHGGGDDRENIVDLIADLAHLADSLGPEYEQDTNGFDVLNSAELHYTAEATT